MPFPVPAAFLVGLLGSCACLAADTTTPPAPARPDASPSATYACQIPPGQVAKTVAGIDAIVRRCLAATGVPGAAVAVVQDDQGLYAQGFGLRDVRSAERVDADTVFQLASVSKPLGATVVARAVHAGTVAWDDPVVKYLPGFALLDPYVTRHVTLEDLYAHRSGLPDHVGDKLEDLGYDRRCCSAQVSVSFIWAI